jgi:hypothetical protein
MTLLVSITVQLGCGQESTKLFDKHSYMVVGRTLLYRGGHGPTSYKVERKVTTSCFWAPNHNPMSIC